MGPNRAAWPDRSWLPEPFRQASAEEVARPHGLYACFWPDGRLRSLQRYRDGLPDGHWFLALDDEEERGEFSDNPRGYQTYSYGRVWFEVDYGDESAREQLRQPFAAFVEGALNRLAREEILLVLPPGCEISQSA